MKTPDALHRTITVLATALIALVASTNQSIAQNPLTNALIAYWPMDEVAGNALSPEPVNGFDMLPYFGGGNLVTNFNGSNIQLVPGYRSNAMSFNRAQTTHLGYRSTGYPNLLPHILRTNWTLSFWVKGTNAGTGTPRVFSIGDTTGGNCLWTIDPDPANSMFINTFIRQTPHVKVGVQYGDYNPNGANQLRTNGIVFDDNWHNITVVQQLTTNLDAPVLDPTQVTTVIDTSATIVWNSEPLDSLTNSLNAPSQVDTNQNYRVQKADVITGPWTTIATVGSGGGPPATQTYTDNNATNPAAFYRVIKPGVRVGVVTWYLDGTNVIGGPAPTVPQVNGAAYRLNGPYDVNAEAFGAVMRGSSGSWGTCVIDDAAVWDRVLSSNEIALYIQQGITNNFPPPPLFSTLSAEFPAVVTNQTVRLDWTASKPPATLALNPGAVNVTPQSSLGVGNSNVTVLSSLTYELVATRSGSSVTSSVSVIAVSNVASGWRYIDSFTYLPDGGVHGQGGWLNPAAGTPTQDMQPFEVHTEAGGNKIASFNGFDTVAATGNGGIAGRKLNSYSMAVGQSNTVFFRFYIDPSVTNTEAVQPEIDINVGITDRGVRDVNDESGNPGPQFRIFRNTGGFGGPIDLTFVNGPAVMGLTPGGYSYVNDTVYGDTNGLTVGAVYSVWMDITNRPSGITPPGPLGTGTGTQTNGDVYVVYLQRADWPSRTNLFAGLTSPSTNIDGTISFPPGVLVSGRDEVAVDATFAQSETLSLLYACMNNQVSPQGTNVVRFDDFFISTSGINTSEPVAAGSFTP